MNSSDNPARAKRVWTDAERLWIELTDGRQFVVSLTHFPRLLDATAQQRNRFVISGGGSGLHWEELDEDISIPGLLEQCKQRNNH